ncbi:hypothetical protein [Streptomyces olivaceiscleroticus]|uniref:DUF8017 domain-containing protein n=1 Tax=Streptomyces olivaceiscleroticus TaxID=68245 RepID=A0ABP3JVE3_9ACTN
MWPGQQPPGGEQNPQGQNPQGPTPQGHNPYQQPGYQQPNPYQQQGYQQPGYQQPNPYQQHPTQPQWQGPGGPQPPNGSNEKKTTVTIAIVAAVAVVAAAVVTGVVVLQGGEKKPVAHGGTEPSKSATAEPSESSDDGGAGGGPGGDPNAPDQPVIKGWQTVINSKRHVAFDVPTKDWTTTSADTWGSFLIADKKDKDYGKPIVTMTAPAYLKENWCTVKDKDGNEHTSALAGTGVKGAQGAKSQGDAAHNESLNWVLAGYDQKQTGTRKDTKSVPFKSDHGITGKLATSTVTGVKKHDKCDSDGKAYAITYTDTTGEYATWVLYAAKGVKGELDEATIKKIMSSLRPLDE